MDDIFMSTVLSDPLACQHVLRIILQEPWSRNCFSGVSTMPICLIRS